ncbi:MAG: hypothetical protein JRG89_02065 [Deltaproteobacteria bacterium]|nr:hypothetical protein [Deltaproteobacteria bacterium]
MFALGERLRTDPRSATICGSVALLFIAHTVYLACVTEDAYITFHYARNLIEGHGLVWNVGEAPVEGYTNFLWLLVCAAVLGLGLDLPSASQWLGVAASLATLVLLYRCGRLLGWSSRFAALPCLALACSGPFAAWATSGMETNAFTLLITAAAYLHARFLANDRSRDAWLCYGSLLLASLTRPEGLLIAAVIALASIRAGFEVRDSNPTRLRTLAFAIVCYGALISLYVLWRWSYFHYPLPNTFYAKTGGGLAQAMRGAHYSGLFALHFVSPWIAALALPLVYRRETLRDRATDGLLPLCLALVVTYSIYICLVGGDYMAMYRFFVPILPLFYLLIGAAIQRTIAVANPTRGLASAVKAAVLLGLAGSLFHSTPLESRWVEKPELMHGNYRGVESERWFVARHRVIGEFFARYGQPGESLATGAIGVVAYFSGLAVYDVHGITDAHIAHHGYPQAVLGSGLPGHEKTDYPYVFAKQPTFYMFSRKLRKEPLAGLPLLVDEVDELVAREYRVGSVQLVDKTNGQSGYFSFLERRDRKSMAR